MSAENVEIVRRVFADYLAGLERGDPGAFFDSEDVSDDYEAVLPRGFEGSTVWRGREEFVELIRTGIAEFAGYSTRVERLIDAGDDRVVALLRLSAVGKRSGAPVEWAMGQVVELDEGRVVRVRWYRTTKRSKPPGCGNSKGGGRRPQLGAAAFSDQRGTTGTSSARQPMCPCSGPANTCPTRSCPGSPCPDLR
jgi:ketosteroid isomerase-like protein